MALAQVGPLTAAFEAFATAVGAGMVIGGFVVGFYGLCAGLTREGMQAEAVEGGYVGGIVGVLAVLVDLAISYIV